MNETNTRKVVIIGAGHVGSHCALSLLFSKEADELVLIDIKEEKARMQALDLDDAASNLSHRVRVRAGTYDDCTDAQIVVMAAGKTRLPGQTRLDMFDDSIAIMNDIVGPLKASGFSGILLSISNPADIVGDFLRKRLGLPKNRVFSTGTSLDSARLRRILSEILGIDRRSIYACSIGEHGDSQVVPVSHCTVGGVPLPAYTAAHPELAEKLSVPYLSEQVQQAGMRVVIGKGCTEFGIGMVCCDLVRAIFRDERRILPVSTLLEGEYGERGIHAGVPAVIGKNGVERVIEWTLAPEEAARFHQSCEVLRGFTARADQM